MNTEEQDPRQKLIQRAMTMSAEDSQFRSSFPLQEVTEAKQRPGLRLAQVVQLTMEGYADRPALGQRARELVTDPVSGRSTLRLLPRFETRTYRELWAQARAVARAWHHDPRSPLLAGDFVCILGFTSPEYATLLLSNIHLGTVSVPLQTSAPTSHHVGILEETQARILAVSIDYLDAAVAAVLACPRPQRLVIFDYDDRADDQRDKVELARKQLASAGSTIAVDTLAEVTSRAASLPDAPLYVPPADEDPLSALFYTSGSTGTPKGAIFTDRLVITTWLYAMPMPVITLSFMPMAHLVGNGYLLLALANGGTSYCSPRSDLSTMLEDFALTRPTLTTLVPRVCELFHHYYLGEVDRRVTRGEQREVAEVDVKQHMREQILGGRLLSVGCGSASLSPETYAFMESMLDMHMAIGYSSTEIAGGTVLVDWKVQRPPVLDYKLVDVPELGYFRTDKPYPRGELLVKSDRFMGGYYKQPELTAQRFDEEGFYRTGDVMAELGPDHLVYLDRRNNVVKLSQGEFVAISRLEALYSHHPQIRQIYIYGTSERAYLLAVVVPGEELAAACQDAGSAERVRATVRGALKEIATEQRLHGYEIPRDFLIETEPFSLQNGLLTEVGKHQRPKLKERYGEKLEQLYARLAQQQLDELRALRTHGAEQPVLETVMRALRAILGSSSAAVRAEDRYGELGGDSLSALEFSKLLEDIYQVEVPVGVILNPVGNVRALAEHIDRERNSSVMRPAFATVHQRHAAEVHASELKLEKFIDPQLLADASRLPAASHVARTVLLTGATGYLGRFLALTWLERLAKTGGKLVLIARGADEAQARKRVEDALSTDATLTEHFRMLAAEHLKVIPGDLGASNLGLSEEVWAQLADSVDLIVHAGAHVNHVLPYNQLFAANVAGTAELIRLAITGRRKRVHYVSTLGVSVLADPLVDEDSDIRHAVPRCALNSSYANGYGASKWASEVLLREAFDVCALPVDVFRPGMILAHSRYVGQLNVPDMFTRLLFSLVVTGIAPATFYGQDVSEGRRRGRYEGFTVDFLAHAITELGSRDVHGFHTYNLSSPHARGASLDDFVDWLGAAGCTLERIDRYGEWLSRFETAMHALPEALKQHSLLALLGPYQRPQAAGATSMLSTLRFREAAHAAGIDIPQLSPVLIEKYLADMRHLRLLR